MKAALIALWSAVLILILAGAGMAISPFVIEGGILNVLFPPSHDNWIGFLLNFVFAVVFGLILMAVGVGIGLWTGIGMSIYAVASQPQPPPPGPGK
jgi:hypothetical protein